jgi:CheY-like chemotaxis protein
VSVSPTRIRGGEIGTLWSARDFSDRRPGALNRVETGARRGERVRKHTRSGFPPAGGTRVAKRCGDGDPIRAAGTGDTMKAPSILLLDHEDMLREATVMMLAKKGGDVTSASTLDEALEHAADRLYDVAILDLSPTSPRGAEIVRAMRERGCLPRRVIVCCGDGQTVDADDRTDVIQKPFPFDRLLKAVFGGHRQRTTSGVFPRVHRREPAARAARAEGSDATPLAHRAVRTPRRAAQGRRARG